MKLSLLHTHRCGSQHTYEIVLLSNKSPILQIRKVKPNGLKLAQNYPVYLWWSHVYTLALGLCDTVSASAANPYPLYSLTLKTTVLLIKTIRNIYIISEKNIKLNIIFFFRIWNPYLKGSFLRPIWTRYFFFRF